MGSEEASRRIPTWLLVVGAFAVGAVLWGGYGHHWPWTGINGRTATLWDWLHLLLLPLAVGVLPIWLKREGRLDLAVRRRLLVASLVFTTIVVAGYTIPWAWTGFVGNSLWDWLNLVALPLAVALTPLVRELREDWGPRHTTVAMLAGVAFTAVVLGGYLGSWGWTGFTGNTLWDWLHLLLLPLLIPAVVVPALMPAARARMITDEPGIAAAASRSTEPYDPGADPAGAAAAEPYDAGADPAGAGPAGPPAVS